MTITSDNFKNIINENEVVLIDFWAPWCGPCRMLAPTIEELELEYQGKAIIGKIDTDNNQEFTKAFGIRSIPTILIFKDGKEVEKLTGAYPKADLVEKIDKLLGK